MDAEVIVFLHSFSFCKSFQVFLRFPKICYGFVNQNEHLKDCACLLYSDLFLHVSSTVISSNRVNPFLSIPIVLQKVLPDKSIPCIALIEVQAFIKTLLIPGSVGRLFFRNNLISFSSSSLRAWPCLMYQLYNCRERFDKPRYHVNLPAYTYSFF